MYRYFGVTGSLLIFLAVLTSMAGYTGKRKEKYSVLNHFISELGEVGVSRGALIFNLGFMAGGLIFIPFLVGLGWAINNVWAKLGMVAGLGSAMACVLIGVFPMNNLGPHEKAAMTFFRAGLATVVFFTLSIFFQPAGQVVVPLWVNGFGLVAILAYLSFLLLPVFKKMPMHVRDILNPEIVPERPALWLLAVLEWLVFVSTIGWFLGVALAVTG
jgi:hypothetical membrane protein